MRRWSLFFLLMLPWAWAQEEELVSKRVYLSTPASFVNLTSDSWKVTDETEQVLVAVRFKAQSTVGRVLSCKFLREDGSLEAELRIALDAGQLQVDLLDEAGSNILIKPVVNVYMNESAEHSVAVKINALAKSLSYSVEQRAEHTAEISTDIQWAGAEIVTTIGGGPRAIIGCVALVAVQVTGEDPFSRVMVLDQNEVDKCPTESECAQRNCGKGRCLALEVATCDCFNTGKTGPSCANEPKTIELDNNDDSDPQQASVLFSPWKEDQKISRLAMDFKFRGTDQEGVLMYGTLEGGGSLKMYVVQNLGKFDIADNRPLNFTLRPNEQNFHSVALIFEEEAIHLSVDGFVQSLSMTSVPLLTNIIFGSSPPKDGVSEQGLTACLRNLYVDHLDLLELQANKDSRVTTSKPLKACSDPNEMAQIPGTKDFPADKEISPIDLINEEDDGDEEAEGPKEPTPVEAGIFRSGPAKKKESMPCEKSQEFLCRNGATCIRGSNRPICICAPGYGGLACQFSLYPRSCAEAIQFHRLLEGPTRLDVDGSGDLSMSVAECKEGGVTKMVHDMPASTVIRAAEVPRHGLFVLSYRDFPPAKIEAVIAHSGSCRQQINYKCNHAPLQFSDQRTWFRVATANATVTQLGAIPNGCQCIDVGCTSQGRCNCDAGTISTDEGVLQGKQAGITSIVALHREGDVSGEMTVSPLECSGFVSESNAIRFQKPGTYLLDDWTSGALSFHFRTADASGTFLRINQGEKKILQLELLDGHTVKAITEDGDIVVESQAKLNDTKWHLIVVEWVSEELRVSVDAASSFRRLKNGPFGNVTLGDLDRGVVGCFRSVLLGTKTVELRGSIDGMLFGRCEDSCIASNCRNGAECRENFATGTPQCVCKHPRLQSGSDCSHDINSDSSVSFHGGHLKFDDIPSPLTSSWVFSFRTDQSTALLLYVHDADNNFMQVHVKDEVNVSLSLNNLGYAYSCTVQAPPGTEYSDMRWIQVYIDHSPSGSTLTVEDEACTIRAGRLLADEVQKSLTPWIPDVVVPPVGVDDAQTKFNYAFIGGVMSTHDEEHKNIRFRATYGSKIEDLLGCVRGVKVGDRLLDLRKRAKEEENKALVQVGCDVKCETLSCHNGGHCSIAWRDFNPETVKTTCDCSRTSYAGPHCLEDVGLTFIPPQSISFDVGAVLGKFFEPLTVPPQTLKFAFNAEHMDFRQMLAILYFDDSSEFEVLLNKNGSLHVGIAYADGRSNAMTFKGNFSDNYRHFFMARFSNSSALRVYVDGVRQDFYNVGRDSLSLYRARRLWVGGQRAPPGLDTNAPPKKNLQGCVSNLNVYLGVNILDLWPISYLETTHAYSNLTLTQPQGMSKGQCAPFRNPNQPIAAVNLVSLPAWETNFRRLEYTVPVEEKEEESGVPWLLLLLAILLIVILVILLVVIVCLCRKGHKDARPQNISLDEREPLRLTQFPQTPPMGEREPHSNYSVPPPDIQLPTAPRTEDLSDCEDFDRTLTPGSQTPTIFEDEISRPTGFDRSSPQRLSSFRDSSVPIGSPLYAPENSRRPRPVNVPRPPVRATSPV